MENQSDQLEPQIELAPASWPKVVGIISIAFATLGLSCLVCGVGMQVGLGASMLPPELRDNPPPSMQFGALQAIQTAISLVTSALLLAAGIQTVRRNFGGRSLHLIWGWLSIAGIAYGSYVAWHTQKAMIVWAQNNPENPMAKGTLQGQTASVVVTIVILAFFSAWPVFCLIWFGLVKRTKESFGAPPNADYI